MPKLVFRKRRGFTLVEVSLATIAGSLLLVSMIYTGKQVATLTDTVYDEAMLEDVARDLNETLENHVPRALAEAATNGQNLAITLDNPTLTSMLSAPGPEPSALALVAMGALGTGMADGSFMIATNPTPTPTATPTPIASGTPTPTPSATPTASTTPAPSATPNPSGTPVPAPTYYQPSSVMPAASPSITPQVSSTNQTMMFGTFELRFQDASTTNDYGGAVNYTAPSGTWANGSEIGSRGMISVARFGFANWTIPTTSSTNYLRFTLDPSISQKVVQVTTTMQKDMMLPFFLQQAWAPRSPNWTWIKTATKNMTQPPSGWPLPPTPPSAKDFPNQNGLFPVGVEKSLMAGIKPGQQVDVLNGAGPGSFGWVGFPNVNDNPTLVNELNNPSQVQFIDAQTGQSGQVGYGSWIHTETGLHGSNGSGAVDAMAAAHQIVTTFVYDTTNGASGNSLQYHADGFAIWMVTNQQGTAAPTASLSAGSDYLQFVGYADDQGNLLPPGYNSVM